MMRQGLMEEALVPLLTLVMMFRKDSRGLIGGNRALVIDWLFTMMKT